ncbi:hypothetical protein AB7942_16525 [Neobacillus sp. BF23-41]|uniref:hypothetical protein n=1 Tax=Neobacillus sp. BF23-41 TaxID=3240280 RepID=UPI0034E3BBF6
MNSDEALLHPDTGVTSGLFVDRSLNEIPLLDQFLDQNRVSVSSLRDFKKTARDLIEQCKNQ